MKDDIYGYVFNIQGYCIHDGPGIRTSIFLKGCPISCLWCQNPESQRMKTEIMYYAERCVGCGACADACPKQAISVKGKKVMTDKSLCDGCGKCVQVCRNKARSVIGEKMSVSQVIQKIIEDKLFYNTSGGGVTITGGEPLMQPLFTSSILQKCQKESIHTAIETCGYAKWEHVENVIKHTDLVLYDIKHMDSNKHKQLTGKGNEIILENLAHISKTLKKAVVIRIPVVPDYNDSQNNFENIGRFIKNEVPTCLEVNLLPYHSLGEGKREQLEMEPSDFNSTVPYEHQLEVLRNIVSSYGLAVK